MKISKAKKRRTRRTNKRKELNLNDISADALIIVFQLIPEYAWILLRVCRYFRDVILTYPRYFYCKKCWEVKFSLNYENYLSSKIKAYSPTVPYKEKEIEKKYYTIGEVADELGVATSLIRFWEGEFDNIKPKKNRKGNRQFTKDDLQNVKLIYHLVKEKGYTLQGARDFISNGGETASDKMETIESLKKIRKFLTELKSELP